MDNVKDEESGNVATTSNSRRCNSCALVCCININLMIFLMVAMAGVYHIISSLQAGGRRISDRPEMNELSMLPKSSHNQTGDHRTRKGGNPSYGEVHLEFKQLYVLSMLQLSNISMTELFAINSSNGSTNMSNYESLRASINNTEVRQDNLCASSGIELQDMFACSKLEPSFDNIFFIESSCAANQKQATQSKAHLTEKQACSIYSAAHHNPSRKVILLLTCPFRWARQWNPLLELPNFFFTRVGVEDLFANTSLLEFYHGPLARSKYPIEHHADLLRMFIIYLYGGTYVDLDIITFKSFDDLGVNFLVSEGDGLIANSIFNAEPNNVFFEKCIIAGLQDYVPTLWSSIGTALFTTTLAQLCKIDSYGRELFVAGACSVTTLQINTFYRIRPENWRLFYDSKRWPLVEAFTNESHGVHYWNSLGKDLLFASSSQPLVMFAKQHCPPVINTAGMTFT